jgi:hypothetical protein
MVYAACGTAGTAIKEKKQVSNFTHIASGGGIDVVFTQGKACSLEIEASAENMSKIDYSVKDGVLKLKLKNGERFTSHTNITAYVSAPALESIAFSGGADFKAQSVSSNESFSAAASGGSDIDIDRLKADIVNIAISGGADADIKDLSVSMFRLAASGGADANIHISSADEADVAASGGSDVTLSGTTKTLSLACSGGADANIKGLKYDTINSAKHGGSDIYQ